MLAEHDNTIITDEEILRISSSTESNGLYKIYFDNITGDIYAITNEVNSAYSHHIEVPSTDIEDFLSGKINYSTYRVSYTSPTESKIVQKDAQNDDQRVLLQIPVLKSFAGALSIKNNTNTKQWAFKLNEEEKSYIKKYKINSKLEFYVTFLKNASYLIRTIKIDTIDLAYNDTVYIDHVTLTEQSSNKIKFYTKPFFKSYGLIAP
jgi:hypothetical protein